MALLRKWLVNTAIRKKYLLPAKQGNIEGTWPSFGRNSLQTKPNESIDLLAVKIEQGSLSGNYQGNAISNVYAGGPAANSRS